jgi:hypothetical protein
MTLLPVHLSLLIKHANINPQLGEAALMIESSEPGKYCAEYANKKNGKAAFRNPKIMKCFACLKRLNFFLKPFPINKRNIAAKPTLASVRTAGPSNGTHALMTINDPPQRAAVTRSLSKLTKLILMNYFHFKFSVF